MQARLQKKCGLVGNVIDCGLTQTDRDRGVGIVELIEKSKEE